MGHVKPGCARSPTGAGTATARRSDRSRHDSPRARRRPVGARADRKRVSSHVAPPQARTSRPPQARTGLREGPARERLVGTPQLRRGLLDQDAPQLAARALEIGQRVHRIDRERVVHDDGVPGAGAAEPDLVSAGVVVVAGEQDAADERGPLCEDRQRADEPAVADTALSDVVRPGGGVGRGRAGCEGRGAMCAGDHRGRHEAAAPGSGLGPG